MSTIRRYDNGADRPTSGRVRRAGQQGARAGSGGGDPKIERQFLGRGDRLYRGGEVVEAGKGLDIARQAILAIELQTYLAEQYGLAIDTDTALDFIEDNGPDDLTE